MKPRKQEGIETIDTLYLVLFNCPLIKEQVNSNRADSVSSANVAAAEYMLYYRRESERRLSEATDAARQIYEAAKTLLSQR